MDPLQKWIADLKGATRVADRKAAAQGLSDYLQTDSDGICEQLDLNSVNADKRSGAENMTWTKLFMEVRDYFKKETDRGDNRSSATTTVNKLFYFGIVKLVFTRATRNRPWLQWNKVLDFITSELQTEKHAIVFGPSLVKLLEDFLSIELYRSLLDGKSWRELIYILIKCYGKYGISVTILLRCLNICINQGSLYEEVISTLRLDVVAFYQQIVEVNSSDLSQNISIYLRGVTSLSKQNANEFRGILCKLGETVIPRILQIQSFKEDEETALLEYLLVQYRLHMPCDVEMTSHAFYADDDQKWKEILRLKYSYCIDTIEEIVAKRNSVGASLPVLKNDLLTLAAKCTKQISSSSLLESGCSEEEDGDGGHHSKKKMRYKSFHTIIGDLYTKQPSEGLMTWLSYLTVVLKDFPQLVTKRTDYSNLVHLGCSLFNTKYMLRREFYLFFVSLLKVEKSLRSRGEINDATDTWLTLWDLTIKSIAVCEDKESAINLLRLILKEIQPSNVFPLLTLYINTSATIPLTESSVQLLADYLSLCSLPNQVNYSRSASQIDLGGETFTAIPCPRLELLKWLMRVDEKGICECAPLIATVMCSLIVKQSHILLQDRDNPLWKQKEIPAYEKLLMKSSFVLPETDICTTTVNSTTTSVSNGLIVLPRPAESLAETIKADFENIPKVNSANKDAARHFKLLITKLNLYLNILNVMENNLIGESQQMFGASSSRQIGFKKTLEGICDIGMASCNKFMTDIFAATNKVMSDPDGTEKIIRSARMLFSTDRPCKSVCSLLSQKLTQTTLTLVKRIFRSNLAKRVLESLDKPQQNHGLIDSELSARMRSMQGPKQSVVELELITKTDRRFEKLSMEALLLLIDYGLICNHKLEFFKDLMDDLVQESFCSANDFIFDTATTLISRATTILHTPGLHDLVVIAFTLLQKCCRSFHQLPRCAQQIWSLFKGIIPVINKDNKDDRFKIMVLVGTLYNFLSRDPSPPRGVYENAFETLMELSKYDASLSWTKLTPKNTESIWVLENINVFFSSRSHQIRMLTADTICCIYKNAAAFDYSGGINSSQDEHPVSSDSYQERRKVFLDNIFRTFLNIFDIEINLSNDERAEESINRTCLVLSCLTRLIFAFPYTQKQTIMHLFMAMKLKRLSTDLAQRALQYASPTSTKTMCCYFPHVLKKLLKLNNVTLEELPYNLFGCQNFNDLATKFRNEISVEFFEQNRMTELETFAKHLNVTSSKNLIKDCYGLIMAKITPGLAFHTYKMDLRGVNLTQNNDIHMRLTNILGGNDETGLMLATCLGDVVLNLISFTFDPTVTHLWNCPEVKLAEPVPPHYSQSAIEKCLRFIQSISPDKSVSVVGYLAKVSHDSIYKIIMSLAIRLHEAPDDLQKYWRLHQFVLFVDLLLNEPHHVFETMKEYVCASIFNSYFRLLKEDNIKTNDEVEVSLRFRKVVLGQIYRFTEKLTIKYPEEMKTFFVPLIRSIVSAAVKNSQLMDASKIVLDFLLKTNGGVFEKCIEALDPFPEGITEFQEYSTIHNEKKYGNINRQTEWPLVKELERLLNDNGAGVAKWTCTKESLKFLRCLLSKRKRDLERMVKNLEARRFSEECIDDPLHRVIQMLVNITLSPHQDQDLIREACRCLGEIGPVDLSILVLPPYKNHAKISSENVALHEIIKIITGYLSSEDIRIVTVAGKVLSSLFHYRECRDLVSGNSAMRETRQAKLLTPFNSNLKPHLIRKSKESIDAAGLESKLALNEMDESIDYKQWLPQLTTGLIECFRDDTSLVSAFLPICNLRTDFCEDIFPYLIYMVLVGGKSNPQVKKTFGNYFRTFFAKFVASYNSASETARSYTPSSSGTSITIIYMNKLALRLLIRVIQFLRRHPTSQERKGPVKVTPWDDNFWLDISYLDVARAAQYCGAYLTSILYIEIASTEIEMSRSSTQSQYSDNWDDESSQDEAFTQGASSLSSAPLFSSLRKGESSKIRKLLLKAYSSIGETDAAYGCGSARFADVQSSMHHLEQTMDWHRLLMLANGSSISNDTQDNLQTCSELHTTLALKQLGLHNILWTFLKGVESMGNVLPEDLTQVQYECGWRLSKWDLKNDKPSYLKEAVNSDSLAGFQKYIYDGICTGLSEDKDSHLKIIQDGFRSVCGEFRHAALESSENIYGFLSRFQMLRVIEDFFDSDDEEGKKLNFLKKWKLHDKIAIGDFKHQEPILYLRNVLLRAYDQKNPRVDLKEEINESLLDLIAKARNAGRLDLAESCATAMSSFGSKSSMALQFQIAKNHWAGGKGDIARDIMSRLIRRCNSEDELYPAFLLQCGDWLSISHSERPAAILKDYLQKSCAIYERRPNAAHSDLSKAHIIVAKYADAQYQNVTKYIGSEVFQAKLEHVERAMEDVRKLQHSVDLEKKKSMAIYKRNTDNDKAEIFHIYKEQRSFVDLALKHYLKGLKNSNENDLLIFRAISLWLETNQDETQIDAADSTTNIFREEMLLSHKYLVVLHQLSARLGSTSLKKNELLKIILVKCAEDHPYHTLPVLLTQALLHKDENPRNISSSAAPVTKRVEAAAQIVSQLKREKTLKDLVTKMERLWLTLITFADLQDTVRNQEGVRKPINPVLLSKLNDLTTVAVPTCGVPVFATPNYKGSIIGIQSFDNSYFLVGGINSPKKITCTGTNGIKYNMLLKGHDDLRQDAVMQQVFGVLNSLLQNEPRTKMRRLHIRTYKVIPLSQRTGIIEWVEDTQTFGDYLVGGSRSNGGAHVRYRPNDYSPAECRKMLMDARTGPVSDPEKKFNTYTEICDNFQPVFRHFFFENFKDPGVFFEKRLAYTRSVATNSIVGYILGLGDRHVLNILIDKKTAEFIHIDLGVAFEQGRILPTPETIPFRLTRDVIDGMGATGVEGVFKKSCEETMYVLRNNAEIILTVLQVLLYDPLYMWALTTDRVAKVQPDSSKGGRKSKVDAEPQTDPVKEKNNAASRVLLRLRQKLMGIEEEGGVSGAISSGSSLSIDGHVSLLIQRAVDPSKLCGLFPGWQPYL